MSRFDLHSPANNPGNAPAGAYVHLHIAGTCLLASVMCVVAFTITQSQPIAFAALAVTLAGAATVVAVGIRPAGIAACLILAPPGLAGENYGVVGVGALAVLWLLLRTAPAERPGAFPFVPILLAAEAGALVYAATFSSGTVGDQRALVAVAILYAVAALVAHEVSQRPVLTRTSLRLFAVTIALTCASYVASWATGFLGMRPIELPYRSVMFAPPASLVTIHTNDYLGTPRFLSLSGEPGLGALFLLVALAFVVTYERRWTRRILLSLLLVGIAAAQSAGLLLAFFAMTGAAAALFVARRVAVLAATAVVLGLIPVAIESAARLIEIKGRTNPLSIADRGLAGSSADSAISLSAAWSQAPSVVIPLVALLALFAWTSIQYPLQFGLVVGIAVISWYAQPVQFHPGLWILLFAVCTASRTPRVVSLRDEGSHAEVWRRAARAVG